MDSRRHFIGKVAGGLATTLADPRQVLGANERIRVGVIGCGDRGSQLLREAQACGAEVVAVSDVYTRRLDEAAVNGAKPYSDWRALLEHRDLDAVLIATPQHLHCEQFVNTLDAGKHVYVEKTMAFTAEQALRMQGSVRSHPRLVVQVGHQACSSGHVEDAKRFLAEGKVGQVTAVLMQMYRNTPHGKAQWTRPVYADMTPGNVNWGSFLGENEDAAFDANQFVNWRMFWAYSGGNVFENMSQQLAFWYKVLDLQIPRAASMTGGIYLWNDGREVPDTMSVSLDQTEGMLVSWSSGFGNNAPGVNEQVLGANGTISRAQQIRYAPQKVNRPDAPELVGASRTQPAAHMKNFLDCIRSGAEPNCPFELGLRVSIACRMAVESYWRGQTVYWDNAARQMV